MVEPSAWLGHSTFGSSFYPDVYRQFACADHAVLTQPLTALVLAVATFLHRSVASLSAEEYLVPALTMPVGSGVQKPRSDLRSHLLRVQTMLTAKCATSCRSEKENVEPGHPDGVHAEEVRGQHLVGVLADELAPGALAATGSKRQVVATEHLADGEVGALGPASERTRWPQSWIA